MSTIRIETRFATFLQHQHGDTRVRSRLVTSALAATIAVSVAGVFGYAAERLGIASVSAPSVQHTITLDLGPPPPPPAPPPDRPAGSAGADDDQPRDEPTPRPRARPVSTPSTDLAVEDATLEPAGSGDPSDVDGSGSSVPGGPACAVPPCGGGGHSIGIFNTRQPLDRKRNPPPPAVQQPAKVVKANAIFAPDPSHKDLMQTKAALMKSIRRGTSTVSFCVQPDGTVGDVKTVKAFPGDKEVDAIVRSTVKRWRFRPFTVAGRPRKTCTTQPFDIVFE